MTTRYHATEFSSPGLDIGHWAIYFVEPDGDNLRRLTPTPRGFGYDSPQFSNDGRYLAYIRTHPEPRALVLYDRTTEHTRIIELVDFLVGKPLWSPDSQHIALATWLGYDPSTDIIDGAKLLLYDVASDEFTTLLTRGDEICWISWSPDNTQLAFTAQISEGTESDSICGHQEVFRINRDGSGETQLTNTGGTVLRVAWSPMGNRLAFVRHEDYDVTIELIDPSGQPHGSVPLGLRSSWPWLLWHPDGEGIVVSDVSQLVNVDITTLTAEPWGTTDLTYIYADSWSPDGQTLLLTASESICWWLNLRTIDTNTPYEVNEILEPRMDNYVFVQLNATWAPDSDLIAFVGRIQSAFCG